MKTPDPHSVSDYFRDLQDQCCSAISEEEPGKGFAEDKWKYADGGGGITRIIENGDVIEKGGVNFSYISGDRLPEAALASRKHISNKPFIATGVSLVMHPRNPFVPTTHMNVRFFVADPDSDNPHWWFGGGYDLTPYYGFEEDCVHWHSIAKSTCDRFGPDYYRKFKESCDEYFYIKHRAEHRGIGGLFFDDFNDLGFALSFDFVKAIGNSFIDAYIPILKSRKETPYSEKQKSFQLYRRGRYVEFNLVYDRGTLFGLQSNGRAESILMSLPPQVEWKYNWKAEAGSNEEKLLTQFITPRNWV